MRINIGSAWVKKKFFCKGQNLAEVALVIGMLGLVLVGMQVYIKRSIQGKVKDLADVMVGHQEGYPTDTSSVIVYPSTTNFSSNSDSRVVEIQGGRRSTTASDNSTTSYSSGSESR